MIKVVELKLLPSESKDLELIKKRVYSKIKLGTHRIKDFRIVKRSIDARGSKPFYLLRVEVFIDEIPIVEPALHLQFKNVSQSDPVIIIGAGPAGYFAALELLEKGLKPIVFDRGKDVQTRRRDLRAIQQFGTVNPHSNYCFGEGGAGTYSDGKLYTRSHKRGNIYKALKLFVEHGAKSDILIDAHPHIGSNKLPGIVANIRQSILTHGGEIHFDAYVNDIIIKKGKVLGVIVNNEKEHFAKSVILATGHSARDIYSLLFEKGIRLESKPFALGVRIEHPQSLIDEIQYKQKQREENLPASSYRLACQIKDRGVFSFCMCPGGLVVPASTAPGEIVVNGMSLSKRNSPFANSGTVVAIEEADLKDFQKFGVFSGLEFQKQVEQKVFASGDGTQRAPAQRLTDFVKGEISTTLPETSYIPGLHSADLRILLPDFVYQRLKAAIPVFGRKMKGYFTSEANVIATESRTSSPIRIPRNPDSFMHDEVIGLFPCGEGAGFAGGIISAALDGQNVARAVQGFHKNKTINQTS